MTASQSTEIKVCRDHQEQEVTPLIWTFAFRGAEYWCPFCGDSSGMMGAGENVESTPELVERLAEYKKRSRQYLRGNSLLVCSETKYRGKWMKFSEMPAKAQAFWRNKAKQWEYKVDA